MMFTRMSACLCPCLMGVVAAAPALAGGASFSDQTVSAGVIAEHDPAYSASFAAGGVVGDFNNDGWTDIYLPVGGGGPDRLFINQGDGTFADEAAAWGIAIAHRGTGAAVADYDGDGWLDIFVTSFGSAGASAPGRHRLYRNLGGTGFVDVAGVAGVNTSSAANADGWGGAWGDYDLDGDLDLAVAGWQTSDGNRLFRNDGDGTFTDVTIAAGMSQVQGVAGFAPRFVDMDFDRYPEIVWIADFSTSQYWKNDGDGTFTNFTGISGTSLDGTEMGATVADFNEDGRFDIYVTTINTNNLYINQGGHVFTNQANAAGVANTGWGWGTVAVDFNHDTLVDIVATTQSGRQYAFLNVSDPPGSLNFIEVAELIGIDTGISGRGLANFDYDNDGDQDLVFFPHNGPVKLFRNDLPAGPDANWIRIFLEPGAVDDIPPHGVGAVIRLTIDGRERIGRIDGGSNYLSMSELSAHFGLGDAAAVDSLVIEWTNGDVTTLEDIAANQTLTIAAGAATIPGDINEDGAVDAADLAALLAAWGACAPDCPEDLNNDGVVDAADLAVLLAAWTG